MANNTLRTLYRRERQLGFTAQQALRHARIRRTWALLEDQYLRLRVEPDDSPDLSFLEQDCYQDTREGRALAKQMRETAQRDGVWGIVGEYRLSKEDCWHVADSVWGFVGDDWKDSGYDTDVMATTIAAFREAIQSRCPVCRRPGYRKEHHPKALPTEDIPCA